MDSKNGEDSILQTGSWSLRICVILDFVRSKGWTKFTHATTYKHVFILRYHYEAELLCMYHSIAGQLNI